jgi:hypothetical protein
MAILSKYRHQYFIDPVTSAEAGIHETTTTTTTTTTTKPKQIVYM